MLRPLLVATLLALAAPEVTPMPAPPAFQDVEGRPATLADLVAGQPTVLVFLRHFGWMFCREQAAQLGAIEPELAQLGARLVFVGNGEPAYAQAFRDEQGVKAPLYVSPDLSAYRHFDFTKGARSTFAPGTFASAARALLGGHRQGATQGAPFQQGGVALLLPDGTVPWLYKSKAAGDHPSPAAVLEAVKAALRPAT